MRYYEQLKENYWKASGKSQAQKESSFSEFFSDDAKEELQFFRYNGYQIQSLEEQAIEIEFLPTDEAVRHILYEIDEEELTTSQKSAQSLNADELHMRLMNKIKTRVMSTESWNPLIFAIFYGRIEIVKFILDLAVAKDSAFKQHLFYLLSDPFRVYRPEEEEPATGRKKGQADKLNGVDVRSERELKEEEKYKFIKERSALVPLVLTLATNNPEMFELLWNHPMLWNKHKYMILLSNIVYDTQNPILIRTFLTAEKTRNIYNSISMVEKQKFVEFTIFSLEKYFMDDTSSQGGFYPSGVNESRIEQQKEDMEEVLNIHMLAMPPFSFVNLTANLLPLDLGSQVDDLIAIHEEYDDNEEGLEILMITLKNLVGRDRASPEFSLKWNLINNFGTWSRKLWLLIE